MSTEQFANNAQTTLTAVLNSTATSLTVVAATGFPTTAQFRILIDNELLLVTSLGSSPYTTWTVTRAIEGTTAASHSSGATVTQVLTAGGLENLDASYIGTGQLALARGGTSNSRWRYRKCVDSSIRANCRGLDGVSRVSGSRLPGQVVAFPSRLTPDRTSGLPFSGDVQSISQAMELSRCWRED